MLLLRTGQSSLFGGVLYLSPTGNPHLFLDGYLQVQADLRSIHNPPATNRLTLAQHKTFMSGTSRQAFINIQTCASLAKAAAQRALHISNSWLSGLHARSIDPGADMVVPYAGAHSSCAGEAAQCGHGLQLPAQHPPAVPC